MSDGNGGGGGGGGGGGSLNFRPSIGQVVSMVMTAQKMKKGVGARRSGPKLWEEKLLEVEERERRTKVIADVWMAEKDGMLKIKRAAEAVDREIQGRDEKSIEILNSLDVKWEAHKMAAIHARKTFAERWGQQNDDVLKLSGEWIERMRWTEHQLQRGEIQLPWERAIAGEDDKKIKARSPVGARTFRSSTLSHGRRPGEVQAQPDGIGIFGDSLNLHVGPGRREVLRLEGLGPGLLGARREGAAMSFQNCSSRPCVTPRSEAETAPSSRRGSIMSMGDMAESMLLGPRFAPPCKKGVGGGVDVVLVDNGRLMIDTPRVEASPCPSSIGPNELLPPLSTPPPPPLPCR